jgi:hypothetical protein
MQKVKTQQQHIQQLIATSNSNIAFLYKQRNKNALTRAVLHNAIAYVRHLHNSTHYVKTAFVRNT